MGNLDLKRLKAFGDAFVRKLIFNSDASSSEFMQILIQLSKENSVEINIQDYEYYLPQNIRFLDIKSTDNLETFSVSFYGSILSENGFEVPYIDSSSASKKFESKPNKKFGVITHIEVSYKYLFEYLDGYIFGISSKLLISFVINFIYSFSLITFIFPQ